MNSFTKTCTDITCQNQIADINSNKKLELYSKYKTEIKYEPYLDNIKSIKLRRQLTKLRISDHKLEIETGRHKGIERNNRICKKCSDGSIGDEIHFLFKCTKFKDTRENIIQGILNTNKSCKDNYIDLMKSEDSNVHLRLCKFIHECEKIEVSNP